MKTPSREWYEKMSELEDGCESVSAGNLNASDVSAMSLEDILSAAKAIRVDAIPPGTVYAFNPQDLSRITSEITPPQWEEVKEPYAILLRFDPMAVRVPQSGFTTYGSVDELLEDVDPEFAALWREKRKRNLPSSAPWIVATAAALLVATLVAMGG